MVRSVFVPRVLAALSVAALLSGCPTFETDRPPAPPSSEPAAEAVEPGPVDPDAPEEFTETESGLKYRIRREGTGETPGPKDIVTVHYKGWLDDGTVFDSSYQRGEPTSFPLDRVVPGWAEGLQYVREGGMIELEVPSKLGYGANPPPGPIPPNATLHFLVELKEIQ